MGKYKILRVSRVSSGWDTLTQAERLSSLPHVQGRYRHAIVNYARRYITPKMGWDRQPNGFHLSRTTIGVTQSWSFSIDYLRERWIACLGLTISGQARLQIPWSEVVRPIKSWDEIWSNDIHLLTIYPLDIIVLPWALHPKPVKLQRYVASLFLTQPFTLIKNLANQLG